MDASTTSQPLRLERLDRFVLSPRMSKLGRHFKLATADGEEIAKVSGKGWKQERYSFEDELGGTLISVIERAEGEAFFYDVRDGVEREVGSVKNDLGRFWIKDRMVLHAPGDEKVAYLDERSALRHWLSKWGRWVIGRRYRLILDEETVGTVRRSALRHRWQVEVADAPEEIDRRLVLAAIATLAGDQYFD